MGKPQPPPVAFDPGWEAVEVAKQLKEEESLLNEPSLQFSYVDLGLRP